MWENLTDEEKIKCREYLDNKFGKTHSFCEKHNEPLYFNDNGDRYLIDFEYIKLLLLEYSDYVNYLTKNN
jgi:hypothetical protein